MNRQRNQLLRKAAQQRRQLLTVPFVIRLIILLAMCNSFLGTGANSAFATRQKTGSAKKPVLPESEKPLTIGLSGYAKLGRWTMITIRPENFSTDNLSSQLSAETIDEIKKSTNDPTNSSHIYSVEVFDPEGRLVRYPIQRYPIHSTLKKHPLKKHSLKKKRTETETTKYRYYGFFKNGRINGPVRILYEGKTTHVLQTFRPQKNRPKKTGSEKNDSAKQLWLKQSALLIATVGRPAGFQQLKKQGLDASLAGQQPNKRQNSSAKKKSKTKQRPVHLIEFDSPRSLPPSSQGYDSLDILVISGQYLLNEQQSRALQTWIRNGGHLIYCRGSNFASFTQQNIQRALPGIIGTAPLQTDQHRTNSSEPIHAEHISRWIPIVITGELQRTDLGSLESFAPNSPPIIVEQRVPTAKIIDPIVLSDTAGKVFVKDNKGPQIVTVPLGRGQVTFCGIAFHRPPLATWKGLPEMIQRLLRKTMGDTFSQHNTTGKQLAQSGINDLGTQLIAMQEHFPQVQRTSIWAVIGWLVLLILLIGPVDYLLVHRVFKKPKLTWVTFPLELCLISYLALRTTGQPPHDASTNSIEAASSTETANQPYANQFEIIDIDATGFYGQQKRNNRHAVSVQSWLSIWSPKTERYNLQIERTMEAALSKETLSKTALSKKKPLPKSSLQLGWFGITENSFRGMYRQGGVSFDQLRYRITPKEIVGLPLPIGTTAHLQAAWNRPAYNLIDNQLTSSFTGNLQGSFAHHLPQPMTDWVLIYGTQIYIPAATPQKDSAKIMLAPNSRWTVSPDTMRTRGVQSWLTKVKTRTVKTQDLIEDRTISTQTRYDPQSLDPQKLLQIISLHQLAGGKKYTGLNNNALSRLELTNALRMGRALLIGRIAIPAATFQTKTMSQNAKPLNIKQQHTFVRFILPVQKERPFSQRKPTTQQPAHPIIAPKPKTATQNEK